jgi:V8-like Glu-specific endopeptidase
MLMNSHRIQRLRRMLDQVDASGTSEGLKEFLESRTSTTAGPTLDMRRVSPGGMEVEIALEGLDVLTNGGEVDADQRFALEAIVMPYHRPVVDVVNNQMKIDQLTQKWQHLANPELRPRVEQCLFSVGRIDVPSLPSLPYAGTGFIVGRDLMMTNRHVALIFAQGLGARQIQFQTGQVAVVDFYHENGRTESESLTVDKVIMIHPYWDMALLKVKGLSEHRKPLVLSTSDPTEYQDREIVVVGYPGYDPTGDDEFQRIQNRIFRGTYYVKRLQPGLLRVRERIESYRRLVDAITHDCSTLGGNSGSAVFAVPRSPEEPIQLMGLHFAGQYLLANYAVPTFDLAQDSRVVDAGVNFAGRLDRRCDFYDPFWRDADAESAVADGATTAPAAQTASIAMPAQLPDSAATATWTLPLQVSISLGKPTVITTHVLTPVKARPAPVEGLFGRQPPLPTSQVPHPFSVASLSTTRFDWRTALSLALASRLAYEERPSAEDTARSLWGMDRYKFLEADDTQCFVASTPEVLMVAFRGTASLGDWLADLDVASRSRPYGKIHRGFHGAFTAVESQLRAELLQLPGRSLLLTGHSLGGALATIAAAEWHEQLPISWIYTFGQPAVGKGEFASFMQTPAARFMRFVNDDDIVARVPPTYRHIGRLFHFDAAGNLLGKAESPLVEAIPTTREWSDGLPMLTDAEFDRLRAELLQQRANRKAAAAESLEAPAVEGLLPSVSDHNLDAYIAKIAAKA